MKKFTLLVCPLAVIACGTVARAGTYAQSTEPNTTFFAPTVMARAIVAAAPWGNPPQPDDPEGSGPNQSSVTKIDLVWIPTPGQDNQTDPPTHKQVSCTYNYSGNLQVTNNGVYDAQAGTKYKFTGNVNYEHIALLDNYHGQVTGGNINQNPGGQPNLGSTPYPAYNPYQPNSPATVWPSLGNDGQYHFKATVAVAVTNVAKVQGATAPNNGTASCDNAAVTVTGFGFNG